MKVIVNTQLGLVSILDPRLCGDNLPLITVIYLLVGQDNSCSAGDVDLRERETKGGKTAGRKGKRQSRINDVNVIIIFEITESSGESFLPFKWEAWCVVVA